eukprot:Sdes_comp20980_c1_seq2m19286
MTWNISKWGVVGGSVPLFLDEQIPSVTSYSYLGFPHTSEGIDWAAHARTMASRHDAFLSGLASCGSHPRTRLAIYRCFVRPLLEYGYVPTMGWSLFSPRSLVSRSVHSVFRDSFNKGVSWVFSSKFTSCLGSLAGLPDFLSRFQALKFRFVGHLGSLSESNPLKSILQRAPAGSFLGSLKESVWRNSYTALSSSSSSTSVSVLPSPRSFLQSKLLAKRNAALLLSLST